MKYDDNKLNYLINVFCNNDYERAEMKKWIDIKGIRYVYEFVERNFKHRYTFD